MSWTLPNSDCDICAIHPTNASCAFRTFVQIKNQPLRTEAGRAPLASPSSYLSIISYFGTKNLLFRHNHILFPMQELARI